MLGHGAGKIEDQWTGPDGGPYRTCLFWITFFVVGHFQRGVASMLETIAVILIILWLLGLVTSTTMGGFIHILLVIAVVVILLRLIRR
jgi:hypothetical protein